MIAQCTHKNRAKHGKNAKGCQRWKCRDCGSTFFSNEERPLGSMRVDFDKAVIILNLLLEGMSIRAASRIIGMKAGTICDLILQVGEGCEKFLADKVVNVQAKKIQMDEIWDFVWCKNKNKGFAQNEDGGDAWTWLAMDADTKMILSHTVGDRSESTCISFLKRLNNATTGRTQVTADGYSAYTLNVPFELGSRVDFAQLVKTYSGNQAETRYSPATITGAKKEVRFGNPDMDEVSTSYSERLNLSIRMHVRRYTRLTNAHSKSFTHHAAMTSLFVAFYNFCRRHESLKKATPAMTCGLTAEVWTIEKLLREVAK